MALTCLLNTFMVMLKTMRLFSFVLTLNLQVGGCAVRGDLHKKLNLGHSSYLANTVYLIFIPCH